MYDECAAAQDRGHELWIQTSCQPLSMEFDMVSPYALYSHSAFEPVKAANGESDALRRIYADPAMRARFREAGDEYDIRVMLRETRSASITIGIGPLRDLRM